MDLAVRAHRPQTGWSEPLPRELDSSNTLIFAFGGATYGANDVPFAELREAFPSSCLVGCSTAGEIHGTAVHDGTISLIVARFARTQLRAAFEPVTRDDSFEVGARLATRLAAPDLRGIFILSDGYSANGTQLVDGLRSVNPGVTVSGGLAGGAKQFQGTWVLAGGRPATRKVSAVGLYGSSIRLGHGGKGGWDKFGPQRRVTRARGNVIFELDGKPALDLYKKYLGELAAGLPATALSYPLAIRATNDGSEQVVRTVTAHSESERSVTFADDIAEGSFAQLMRANLDRLIGAAADAGALAAIPGARLCIVVSCVGRRRVLGVRAEEEIEAVAEALPECAIAGFYSFGEISPIAGGECRLHNQTLTLTTFAED